MTLLLTFIGFAIAVWFGRTAGRLGHGFTRAILVRHQIPLMTSVPNLSALREEARR